MAGDADDGKLGQLVVRDLLVGLRNWERFNHLVFSAPKIFNNFSS
jgi:hypothetical protein